MRLPALGEVVPLGRTILAVRDVSAGQCTVRVADPTRFEVSGDRAGCAPICATHLFTLNVRNEFRANQHSPSGFCRCWRSLSLQPTTIAQYVPPTYLFTR